MSKAKTPTKKPTKTPRVKKTGSKPPTAGKPTEPRMEEPDIKAPPKHKDSRPIGDIGTDSKAIRDAVPVDAAARKALWAHIKARGCVDDPVDVTPEGTLVDGYGRYEGAKKAGLETIPVVIHEEWRGLTEARLVEESRKRNVQTRRNLTEPMWVELGRSIEQEIKGSDKAAGGKLSTSKPKKKTRDRVADRLRELGFEVSGKHYDKAKQVLALGEAGTAPVADLYKDGVISVEFARKIIRKGVTHAKQEEGVTRVGAKTNIEEKRREAKDYFKKQIKSRLDKHDYRTARALIGGLHSALEPKKLTDAVLSAAFGKGGEGEGSQAELLDAIDKATKRLEQLKERVSAMKVANPEGNAGS